MRQAMVFVSYSHKDSAFAQRLVSDLHRAGADVWVDTTGLTHGNFMQGIDEALEQCAWMVLVLTPYALASKYVKDEVYAAINRVKQGYMHGVIPIQAAPCASGTIPPQWDLLHRYDAMYDYAAALADVLRAIGLPSRPIEPAVSTSASQGYQVSPAIPADPESAQSASLDPDAELDDIDDKVDIVHPIGDGLAGKMSAPIPPQRGESDDLLERAHALWLQGHYEEMLPLVQHATQLAPHSSDAWLNLGRALIGLERYDVAREVCDRALSLDSTSVAAWGNKGRAYQGLGRYEEALAAYEQALDYNPTSTAAWYQKGRVLRSLERYEEALTAFELALTFDPAYSVAWNGKGAILHHLKRYEEALAAYEQALGLDATSVAAWINKSNVLENLKRYEESLAAYEQVLALKPTSVSAWINKGNVLGLYLSRHEEALTAYEQALDLDATSASAWHGKGLALQRLKRYEGALTAYEQALTLAPTAASTASNRADVLRALGRTAEARTAKRDADMLWRQRTQ